MTAKSRRSRFKVAIAVVAAGFAVLLLADVAWTLLFGRPYRGPHLEGTAVSHLRSYLGGQGTFQRIDRYGKDTCVYANPVDGVGFPDLFRVGGPVEEPDGDELKLIDLSFARATSPGKPKAGYWYIDIVADRRTGPYDFTKECGLCAVPATYGGYSLHTFIINIEGTVYRKDNSGKPVTVWPDVEKDGWRAEE
ncbi:MAG: hypothetical protein ACYS9X_08075 [Planctomycetota bacterium]|jgi:hypothetical protein